MPYTKTPVYSTKNNLGFSASSEEIQRCLFVEKSTRLCLLWVLVKNKHFKSQLFTHLWNHNNIYKRALVTNKLWI